VVTLRITLHCSYCGKRAELVTGREVYPHRPDLYHLKFYRCVPCDARVGLHPDGRRPLGPMANATLRALRIRAHDLFDAHWLTAPNRKAARERAYEWLAESLGISRDECHIGYTNEAECQAIIEFLETGAKP
jgi:hypothetical protein